MTFCHNILSASGFFTRCKTAILEGLPEQALLAGVVVAGIGSAAVFRPAGGLECLAHFAAGKAVPADEVLYCRMIIDAHVHLPSEGWPKHTDAFATVADAIAYLHAAGTSFALFTPWQGVLAETPQDLDTANSAALALTERYPEFLCPGVSLHPEYPELSRQWLARFRNRGFRWVGELVSYHRPYRYLDDAFVSLCAECAAQGHIVQLHTHADIAELAARLPELRIVCSHIDAELCRKLADRPNVWLDISGFNGGICIGAIETAVATLGVDRLLYGTDFTSYEPRAFQVRLAAAVADSDARERILWRNAARLLALAGFTVPGVPRTTADA